MDKNKIMEMGDSSLRSGFGKCADKRSQALTQAGFDVFFLGWGFRYETPITRNGYTLLPSGNDAFGADALPQYLQQIKPEVLITQADTRMIAWLPPVLKQIPSHPSWVFYPVIDGTVWDAEGKNLKWPSDWTNVIKQADKVVAMTNYGRDILKANGVDSQTIYHGVDTGKFVPISDENRAKLKQQVGLGPDTFIFGSVFKNMQRKNPEKYLQAFKLFLDSITPKEQEKVALLMHTNIQPTQGGEFNIIQQAIDYGLTPGKNVVFSPSGTVPEEMMQLVYEAMDVFVHLGTMEGFGLPIIEAMSCGLPSIGVKSCTMPEIFADTALISDTPKYNDGHKISYGSYNGVEADLVDPADVAKQMLKLYRSDALRKELGMKATERAIRVFDWNVVNAQWITLIKSLVIDESKVPAEWANILAQT